MAMKQRNTLWRDDMGWLREWVIYSILALLCVGSWAIPLVGFILYDVANDYPPFMSKYYVTYIEPHEVYGFLGEDNYYNLNHWHYRIHFSDCPLKEDCIPLIPGQKYMVFGVAKSEGCQAIEAHKCISTRLWIER